VRVRVAGLVGVLVLAAGALVAIGATPAGAAPNAFMLLVNTNTPNTCQLAGIDLATGMVTPTTNPASAGACASDLAETSDGRVFGIQQVGSSPTATVQLLQYNTTSGAPTPLGQIGTFNALAPLRSFGGVTFDKNGNLFVEMFGSGDPNCSTASVCLYRVDPTNPANVTFLGLGPTEAPIEFLTAACDGRVMTLEPPVSPPDGGSAKSLAPQPGQSQAQGPIQAQASFNSVLASRNTTNGALSAIGTGVGANNELTGIAFDSGGTLWGVGQTIPSSVPTFNVFTVNTTTGVATVGPTLSGASQNIVPFALALPLSCTVPTPPSAPAAVIVTPKFTG